LRLQVVYFTANISAKHYLNSFMYVTVIASKRVTLFETQCRSTVVRSVIIFNFIHRTGSKNKQ